MMQVKNGKIMAIMSSEIKLEHEEEKCCRDPPAKAYDTKKIDCNKVFPATSFVLANEINIADTLAKCK